MGYLHSRDYDEIAGRTNCRFCGYYIKDDGAHWTTLIKEDGGRLCKKSPMMTKMHAPEEYANVVELP